MICFSLKTSDKLKDFLKDVCGRPSEAKLLQSVDLIFEIKKGIQKVHRGFNLVCTKIFQKMESFKKVNVFEPAVNLSDDLQIKIKNHFHSLKDIDIVELTTDRVKMEYYPQLYSEGYLEEELKRLGVSLRKNTNKKGFFKRMMDKLAKDNKEAFGEKELDCCKLPKNK